MKEFARTAHTKPRTVRNNLQWIVFLQKIQRKSIERQYEGSVYVIGNRIPYRIEIRNCWF